MEPKGVYFQCGKEGHWKRNCKEYLESLKGKKKEHTDASASGIYTIEICSISCKSLWVLYIGCGYHLCNDMQSLRNNKKVSRGQYGLLGDLDIRHLQSSLVTTTLACQVD